jgi:ppGpp synthetase/RelA/SpoT-type nucleotidyltranferase
MTGLMDSYEDRFDALVTVAAKLDALLKKYLENMAHIDRISSRAKDPVRFASKAAKLQTDGTPKYSAPLQQIQDQIGARVVVFYTDDVDKVAEVIDRYFRHVERKDHVPDSFWEFGYFGRHWILALPDDVIPSSIDPNNVPRFFELQVKTLFQHAWSEANHDLGYKATGPLTADQQRRFAFTAAQAWGADRVFEELRDELLNPPATRLTDGSDDVVSQFH